MALVRSGFIWLLIGCGSGWVCTATSETNTLVRPLFKDFMGINGHTVQFRPQLYRPAASLVRDYHPVEWDLGTDPARPAGFPFARNGVNWSNVYGGWTAQGWRTDVCLMFETLARTNWHNPAVEARDYGQRFARAFGPSGINPLVQSVEIGNEPGSWSDADYRLMFENMARGLRAGDPRLIIASCALTIGKSHTYAKSTACLEGLENCYDVLTLHTYAQLENWPTWRRSFPEDPRLKEYLQDIRALCSWRDQHAPGKEVWITEFGYDSSTRIPDPQTEFKQWVGVTAEQQAQWIVRSWLVFSSLPVSRAYMFFFNDDDAPQLHGSSGLTRRFEPKPSFYSAAYLRLTLADFRFNRIVLDRPGDVLIYEFRQESQDQKRIWVAWSPTGENRSTAIELPSPGGTIVRAELLPTAAGAPPRLELNGAQPFRFHVTETPLFLFIQE